MDELQDLTRRITRGNAVGVERAQSMLAGVSRFLSRRFPDSESERSADACAYDAISHIRGTLRFVPATSDDFMCEKREEVELENRG